MICVNYRFVCVLYPTATKEKARQINRVFRAYVYLAAFIIRNLYRKSVNVESISESRGWEKKRKWGRDKVMERDWKGDRGKKNSDRIRLFF